MFTFHKNGLYLRYLKFLSSDSMFMVVVLPLACHQGLLLVGLLFISLTASGMCLFYSNVHCRTGNL